MAYFKYTQLGLRLLINSILKDICNLFLYLSRNLFVGPIVLKSERERDELEWCLILNFNDAK